VDFAFSSHFPMRISRRPADHKKHPRLDQRYSTYTRQLPGRVTAPKVVKVVSTRFSTRPPFQPFIWFGDLALRKGNLSVLRIFLLSCFFPRSHLVRGG